jgi:ABC-type uncharacterized transport system permease subunit
MGRPGTGWIDWLLRVAGIVVALVLSALVILAIGQSPLQAVRMIGTAAYSDLASILRSWAPILLCSAGLLLTFSAGMWNIGIEGQISMGAIFATGAVLLLRNWLPPAVVLVLAALASMLGGALWAALVGVLRRYGNINEIFSGMGLNFVTRSLIVYLILGPWGRPGTASTSGTEAFTSEFWLPAFPGFNVSPIEVLLGLVAIVMVAVALRGTHFGLRLKAIGKNLRSAFLLGVPTEQYLLLAFALCGALAGLAGYVLVLGAGGRHNLLPGISQGYGFLAILVVLLANLDAIWSLFIAFFFAALAIGSWQLDASLGNVIQGLLVLSVLITQGLRDRIYRQESRPPLPERPGETAAPGGAPSL